jgi:hypothetical protein
MPLVLRYSLCVFATILLSIPLDNAIAGEEPASGLILIPSSLLFPPPLADPQSPIPYLQYLATTNDETHLGKVAAGATFGLARFDAGAMALQLNIEGGIFSRFDLHGSFTTETVDYLIGFPIDMAPVESSQGWAFQLTPYHTSSHLLDQTIFKNGNSPPPEENEPYTRDVIRLLTAYRFSPLDRLYAGFSYAFNGVNRKYLHNYQAGSEFFSSPKTVSGSEIRLYMADDLQVKEETDWNLNLNLQVGVSIQRPGEQHRLRIAIEYFAGSAVEGQLHEQNEQNIGLAAFFDL